MPVEPYLEATAGFLLTIVRYLVDLLDIDLFNYL
jgi:hypothetical protein